MEENNVMEEVLENKEGEVKETSIAQVQSFEMAQRKSKTEITIQTTISDEKKIFNLDSHVDYKLNECKGEIIRIKDVLMKQFKKPLEDPIVNAEGEIEKEFEIKRITILIDEVGKSYVTASKTFSLQMLRYINMFGIETIKNEGLAIKIIEVPVKNSSNKALGFELV